MPSSADRQREQARVRQTRQRRRARADQLDLQAEAKAATLPRAWQSEFLDFVRSDRARAAKALTEVEKSALLLNEGPARDAYLKRNYRHTKVSLTRLAKEFVRRKTNLAHAELDQNEEYFDYNRLGVEDINWADLQEVASVLGDPSDMDLVVLQPMVRFNLSILLAGITIGHTLVGFSQALELFRFLDEIRVRQIDTLPA